MGAAELLAMDKTPKVLMIDDDEDILMILQISFSKVGWKVFKAADGKRALSMMSTDKFDAILTDLHMPRMSGIEFLSRAKMNNLNRSSKLFVISGAVDQENLHRIIDIGVDNVLVKPFNPDAVVSKIAQKCKSKS